MRAMFSGRLKARPRKVQAGALSLPTQLAVGALIISPAFGAGQASGTDVTNSGSNATTIVGASGPITVINGPRDKVHGQATLSIDDLRDELRDEIAADNALLGHDAYWFENISRSKSDAVTTLLRLDNQKALDYQEFNGVTLPQLLFAYRKIAPVHERSMIQSEIDALRDLRMADASSSANIDRAYIETVKPIFKKMSADWSTVGKAGAAKSSR